MTLEQIKNDYAVGEKYSCWDDLLSGFLKFKDTETMNKHLKNLLEIYAMECLKLASDNAEVNCFNGTAWIETESITNENNIIK